MRRLEHDAEADLEWLAFRLEFGARERFGHSDREALIMDANADSRTALGNALPRSRISGSQKDGAIESNFGADSADRRAGLAQTIFDIRRKPHCNAAVRTEVVTDLVGRAQANSCGCGVRLLRVEDLERKSKVQNRCAHLEGFRPAGSVL